MRKISRILICIFLVVSCVMQVKPSTIAIDFGTEFITTTVISSRRKVPTLVENPLSRTKTNSYLSISNTERKMGYDALVKKAKSPKTVFYSLQEFLAQTSSSESVKNYLKTFFVSYDLSEDPKTKQITFKVQYGNKQYFLSSEELIAMMLKYIKAYAEKFSQSDVYDCVITIPNFYTYKQRQAMINAVALTKMRLLRIVHDNIAASVKFFSENRFGKEKKIYMFYNMGASYTQVSLISINSQIEGTKSSLIEKQFITVLDEDFDKHLGGRLFDIILAKVLYKKYQKEVNKKDISSEELDDLDSEIIQRMLPSALKYKEVLSANKEIPIKILGIEKGVVFESLLTRNEFLDAAKSELSKVYLPIERILKRNEITIDQIEQIEFIGGGHRIPAIKEIIGEHIPQNKIGIHLNGDDVVAFGAGLIAVNATGYVYQVGGTQKKFFIVNNGPGFKVNVKIKSKETLSKKEKYCDESLQTLAVDCIRKIEKTGQIFKRFFNLTSERSVSFSHDSDLVAELYNSFDDKDLGEHFLSFKLDRISSQFLPEIIKENPEIQNDKSKVKIKLIFSADKLGLISLKGEIIYQVTTYYTLVKTKKNNNKITFKFLQKKPQELTKEEIKEYIKEVDKSKDYSNDEKKKIKNILESGDVNKKEKIEEKKKIFLVKEDEILEVYPYQLSKNQIKEKKNVLSDFDILEKKNTNFSERKNELETKLYELKEFLKNKEKSKRYATDKELEELAPKVEKVQKWYDEIDNGNIKIKDIHSKIAELREMNKVFSKRKEDEKKRNISIKHFKSELKSAMRQGKNWAKEKPWIESYLNNDFKKIVDRLEKWIEDLEEKQSKLNEYDEPVIVKSELDEKLRELGRESKKMKNLPKPSNESDL